MNNLSAFFRKKAPAHAPDQKIADFYGGFIKPGTLCFDVGANIGERSAIFLQLGARVVCIEPQRDCVKTLKTKYKRNSKVEIVEAGLASVPGKMTLSICRGENTISTFSEKWKTGRFSRYKWNEQYVVPVTTLDAIIQKYGLPDFCKIDVEGFELEVLKGLSTPIPLLSFEFTREYMDDARECVRYLQSLGKVEFNFSLGDNLLAGPALNMNEWGSNEDLFARLDSYQLPLLWGDIYARSA